MQNLLVFFYQAFNPPNIMIPSQENFDAHLFYIVAPFLIVLPHWKACISVTGFGNIAESQFK